MNITSGGTAQTGSPNGDSSVEMEGSVGGMIRRLAREVRRFRAADDGAALVEYGLILLLIALLCIIAVRAVGSKTSNVYNQLNTQYPG